ncbi:hypothetical protein FACS189483_05780 [Spirochaetia bacterium]|nr:hypothetical protein FACS189483_05780 [Spirochaetia bacterium]
MGILIILIGISCATKPPPSLPNPTAALRFSRIEADSIDRIKFRYTLEAENPRGEAARITLEGWHAEMNGVEPAESRFTMPPDARLEAYGTGEFPVLLELDLDRISLNEGSASENPRSYEGEAQLTLDLVFTYDSGIIVKDRIIAALSFPLIREPDFTITAITVKKAELINVRLKVDLRVDNPNYFPVELSALSYELYGDDRFWANGRESNLLTIPSGGSAETELTLVMNFIDMPRGLLDQIVTMRHLRYRFTGEALVGTGVDYLPQFRLRFERAGDSEVVN